MKPGTPSRIVTVACRSCSATADVAIIDLDMQGHHEFVQMPAGWFRRERVANEHEVHFCSRSCLARRHQFLLDEEPTVYAGPLPGSDIQ